VSSTACFWPDFLGFSLIFEAKSTHVRRLLVDTRYPAEVPAVFRPGCWKLRSCRSLELGAWPSRARASLFSICACRPRSALFGRAWRRLGFPALDLRPGASGCGACPTRAVTIELLNMQLDEGGLTIELLNMQLMSNLTWFKFVNHVKQLDEGGLVIAWQWQMS
jgi:hypothetical protein